MNIYQTTLIRFLWIALVLAVLMGCGAKAGEFKQTAGEMKEGPGVLTGEEGEFTLYDSNKGGGLLGKFQRGIRQSFRRTRLRGPGRIGQNPRGNPNPGGG